MSDKNDTDQNDDASELTTLGRRKLLRLGVYSAPLIIGTLTLSRTSAAASCMPTCMPAQLCPPDLM